MAEINEYRQTLQPIIIAEAEKQFREQGIKSVTMEQISKTLHISKRTIYELYTNKENILIEVLQVSHKRKKIHMEEFAKHCNNVMDILIEVLRLQMESSATTHPYFFRDLAKYPKAEKMLAKFQEEQQEASSDFFERGVDEGYFLSNIDFRTFMRIMSAMHLVLRNDGKLNTITFQELLNNYICVLMRGICTQKGLVELDQFLEQHITR